MYLTVFNRPVNNIIRIAIDKKATEIPVSAFILDNQEALEVKHSDIGFDLDKNTYYDILLPKDYNSNKAFVIKMKMGKSADKTEKLMDAKM